MNTEILLTAGITALLVLAVGLCLIFVSHILKSSREEKIMRFIGRDLVGKVRKMAIDLMSEGMDIIPEKLMEAKRTVEQEVDLR